MESAPCLVFKWVERISMLSNSIPFIAKRNITFITAKLHSAETQKLYPKGVLIIIESSAMGKMCFLHLKTRSEHAAWRPICSDGSFADLQVYRPLDKVKLSWYEIDDDNNGNDDDDDDDVY